MIKARENSIRFWALIAVLILSGGIINAWERAGEARVSRKPLKEFPRQVGSWRQQGDDVRFDLRLRGQLLLHHAALLPCDVCDST